jgi:hypothetical protein
MTYRNLLIEQPSYFTLRKKHTVFEKSLLGRIFGSGRDEVTGGWRNLHNEELHSLYSSTNIITKLKSKRVGWAVCLIFRH